MRTARLVLYFLYGLGILGLLGWTQYRGWSPLSVNEVRTTPKSVRDNPGAYRSPYVGGGVGRYPRGK